MNAATAQTSAPQLTPGEVDNLYEVVNGEVVELEPMGAFDTALASELAFFLRLFAREHAMGLVVTETLFVLDAALNLRRRPDAAYVSYGRWPEQSVPRAAAWNVVPDLAVEVVSPTNIVDKVDEKIVEYFAAGVQLVWAIYPETERIYVYASANDVKILERSETLNGGEVLPAFELSIDTLFSGLSKPE